MAAERSGDDFYIRYRLFGRNSHAQQLVGIGRPGLELGEDAKLKALDGLNARYQGLVDKFGRPFYDPTSSIKGSVDLIECPEVTFWSLLSSRVQTVTLLKGGNSLWVHVLDSNVLPERSNLKRAFTFDDKGLSILTSVGDSSPRVEKDPTDKQVELLFGLANSVEGAYKKGSDALQAVTCFVNGFVLSFGSAGVDELKRKKISNERLI